MIVLDTNTISEVLRPVPDPEVETWLAAQVPTEIYTTSVSEAELRYGIIIMPDGKRRMARAESLEKILRYDFLNRVLPFDSSAAKAYAIIAAGRRAAGRPVSEFDCQIAAICHSQGAAIATRNVRDFEGCGIKIINPWSQ